MNAPALVFVGPMPRTTRIRDDALPEKRAEHIHQVLNGSRIEIRASPLALYEAFDPDDGVFVQPEAHFAQRAQLVDDKLGVLFDEFYSLVHLAMPLMIPVSCQRL